MKNAIFRVSFCGALISCAIVITLGYYWLGLAIGFVGCFGAVFYMQKKAVRTQIITDERAEFIEGKASSLTFKVMFITMGVLLAILGGLSIVISAYAVIGALFALTSIVHIAAVRHYGKRYS